jgi:ATP-dependent DNA ligase
MVGGARASLARSLEHPAHLVVFDVLHTPDEGDVRRKPLRERRLLLEGLLAGAPPQLVLCPQTTDVEQAREWLETWPSAVGVEGLVVKGLDQRYSGGKRYWGKLKY